MRLVLDKFLDGRFTLKKSLVKLSLQIFTIKFSLINLCIVKAGERVVSQKAIVLMLFKMADKISVSQRALPEVMSQRYLKSAIYPSQCNVEKTTEMDCIL